MEDSILPTGMITVSKGKEMEDLYKQEFYPTANLAMAKKIPGYSGAMRSFWFDLANLKNYIKHIEDYAATKGHTGLGVRIYLGAEEKLGQDGLVAPRQAVFFVPTCRVSSPTSFTNENITGVERLDFGWGDIPDSVNSDTGTP
ncbi:MAG: hypothetical protein H3C39_07625 [Flavobacteriia bacterium]|nr:hypothetical protein [Flavobacteriia bacterium]